MTTIRVPPDITEPALAKALATLDLVIDGHAEHLPGVSEPVYRCVPSGEAARARSCSQLGCAREATIRINQLGYCATHARVAMEEDR